MRVLSLRGARNLNERRLRGALKYACRASRPAGTPRLKALYVFSDPARDWGEDPWYEGKGEIIRPVVSQEWAETMVDCQGLIAFDAPLCKGPRHLNSPASAAGTHPEMTGRPFPQWAVATDSLPGCAGCGAAPEGSTTFNPSADQTALPLLPPAPHLSSSLRAATRPFSVSPSFIARCQSCLDDRHCATCNKWWCETCYAPPELQAGELLGYADKKVWFDTCIPCRAALSAATKARRAEAVVAAAAGRALEPWES
ncbi:hypothetical protein IMZ48_42330 [Candidatus Bathyarchaeota archaeon]|nr:hypothetical protein [Candidatus Bathyarchaeota archaeon]